MKILWCIGFYLVFNNFQTIESQFQIENEETNSVKTLIQKIEVLQKLFKKSNKECLQQNVQRLEALEKLHEENKTSSIEQNQQRVDALEKLFEKHLQIQEQKFDALEKLCKKKVDCSEECKNDELCASVFWNNTSNSECRFNQDKRTLVKFVPGELYYCKDCQTSLDSVFEAEHSGVIKLANVAMNKTSQASSYANALSDPSKAVDGDLNTSFTSKALQTNGEPWLMVDLGQRFLVAQIRIQVITKSIHKSRGGYFQVCLVDSFDRKVNPCNQHSEILKVNRRLDGYSELFDVNKVIMGRYVVIKKLEEKLIEIAELEVLSVVPITPYECAGCLAESNTVCDESRSPPVCSCAENHFPVDGDARNGCKDPCNGFKDMNNDCSAISFEQRTCKCKEGHFKVFEENPCFGCINPCVRFAGQHTICSATDANSYKCSCEQGFIPIHGNEPCHGCEKEIVCPSSLGYEIYSPFGCLKEHRTNKNWKDARSTCVSEGGDLFSPGYNFPLLPKDEMNLRIDDNFWIGARRNGNVPYERVNSGGKLPDDSHLWFSAYTGSHFKYDSQPERGTQECVFYRTEIGRLGDGNCNHSGYFFICQIQI